MIKQNYLMNLNPSVTRKKIRNMIENIALRSDNFGY